MTEPTILCPNCKTEIKLTESLAAPLLESTRRDYEQRLTQKESEVSKRETAVRKQQAAIAKAQESIDEQVAAQLKVERAGISAAEAKKAREALADEIEMARQDKAATEALLKDRDTKLAEARKNELELRQDRQRLQEEKEQFELEMQRAVDAERSKIRESAQKDADEQARLKLAEKDKTITDLQTKLQDALRKAEQGSQQLQGEIQELELEAVLRENFPRDSIEPVPKGEYGGDVLHRVLGPSGQPCGSILWESKRTRNWSDGWLAKLREDMRAAGAEIAVVVSQALPKDTDTFNLIDGVWVTSFKCAVPLGVALRHTLIGIAATRTAGEGQQTKMEMVYQYLTGPRFRHRVQAIVEKFTDMQEDLERERKTMTRLWAKREEQIRGVIESTAGMYGDLQGIAGKTMQEIEGLEVMLLPQETDIDGPK
ncbi:MAG: DUF2130 domain-containing protein [Phycisphaerae bacterium]|nr:DUF2130 domain-containing protein [Phycisphaerae bacterium]